jgi:superfamily II DNA/RNA helicase
VLKQLVNKAASGEPKSIQLLLGEIRLVENREQSYAQPILFDETDREVIRQLYERLRNAGEELEKGGTK